MSRSTEHPVKILLINKDLISIVSVKVPKHIETLIKSMNFFFFIWNIRMCNPVCTFWYVYVGIFFLRKRVYTFSCAHAYVFMVKIGSFTLLYGISTFVGYLRLKPPLPKNRRVWYLIHSWVWLRGSKGYKNIFWNILLLLVGFLYLNSFWGIIAMETGSMKLELSPFIVKEIEISFSN